MNNSLSLGELSATPREVARQGWSVVMPGDVFSSVCSMFELILTRCLIADRRMLMDLASLHHVVVSSAVPVKPTLRKPKT